MTITEREIKRLIAKREGKKKEVDAAQIEEIYGIVCDLVYEYGGVQEIMWRRGYQRARQRRLKNDDGSP